MPTANTSQPNAFVTSMLMNVELISTFGCPSDIKMAIHLTFVLRPGNNNSLANQKAPETFVSPPAMYKFWMALMRSGELVYRLKPKSRVAIELNRIRPNLVSDSLIGKELTICCTKLSMSYQFCMPPAADWIDVDWSRIKPMSAFAVQTAHKQGRKCIVPRPQLA